MKDGTLLILKPYADCKNKTENYMVLVKKINNFFKPEEHFRNKYIERSNLEVTLMSNYEDGKLMLVSKIQVLI